MSDRFDTQPRDHRFFGVVTLIAALCILGGFGNVYGTKLVTGVPVEPGLIHLHAAVFVLWLVVLLTQAALVRRGRIDLHERVGFVGIGLAIVMLGVGYAVSVAVTRLGATAASRA
jgi:hypothetical protein